MDRTVWKKWFQKRWTVFVPAFPQKKENNGVQKNVGKREEKYLHNHFAKRPKKARIPESGESDVMQMVFGVVSGMSTLFRGNSAKLS